MATDNFSNYQAGGIPDWVTDCSFLDTTKLARGCSYSSGLTTDVSVKLQERRPGCCCYLTLYRYDTSYNSSSLSGRTANLYAKFHMVQLMQDHFYFD